MSRFVEPDEDGFMDKVEDFFDNGIGLLFSVFLFVIIAFSLIGWLWQEVPTMFTDQTPAVTEVQR